MLGSQTFAAMLSGKRAQLMIDIKNAMNQDTAGFGIRIVDVRIRHADLPQANSMAIYQRMQKEREREAAEYRAEGDETAQRIRARAAREVTILTAEATRESEILRGEGDAEKTRILGEAFSQDPEFFAFYRSMQAYQDSLTGNSTVVLSPDSDFLKYFGKGPNGTNRPATATFRQSRRSILPSWQRGAGDRLTGRGGVAALAVLVGRICRGRSRHGSRTAISRSTCSS